MTTNPYASPADVGDLDHRSAQEIRSVIRTFRMMSIFAIAEAVLFFSSFLFSIQSANNDLAAAIFFAGAHAVMIICSICYLMIAARMARKDAGAAKWARRMSLLMILSFPLFPIGIFCLPVFAIVGVLCYRKVARYYSEFCMAVET